MNIEKTPIEGLLIIAPKRHGDARGWFSEVYARSQFLAAGLDLDFLQDNHSMSGAAGPLRGLPYQRPPYAPANLVRLHTGGAFCCGGGCAAGQPQLWQMVRGRA